MKNYSLQEVTHGKCKVPNFLNGNPAYPLTSYCMKEYTSCTIDSKVIFTNMFRSARNPIKCAFGRLKARSIFLSKRVDLQLKFISTAIMFVLFFTKNLTIVQLIKN